MKSKMQKRKEADERAVKRAKLSDQQQLEIVMQRTGNRVCSESNRLVDRMIGAKKLNKK